MSKIKGITIWEQNAEYFALGIAALALVAFVIWQVIGEPNAVTVSGHGKVTPADVDQRLVDAAQRLDAMLSPDAAPPVSVGDPKPVLPEFEQALVSGVSPSSTMRSLVASVPISIGERVRVGETFTMPEVPAPTAAVARQYFDTLIDEVITENGLDSMFTTAPYDVSWVTAAAAIDLDAVLNSYRSTGPSGNLAPIPTSWHAGQATILDVRVERQERTNDGWGNSVLLDPLPGQLTYRSEIQDGVDAAQRESIVRTARDIEMQQSLAQPAFYATRNSAFIPPDPNATEIEIEVEGDEELAAQVRKLRRLEREIQEIKHRLEELGGPLEAPDAPTRPGSTPGSSSGTPAGGPSTGDGPLAGGSRTPEAQESDNEDKQRKERARRSLTQRLERKERDAEATRAGLPIDEAAPVDQQTVDDGTFIVWAHDMGVVPGRTYRYRVVVDVYNPLYLRRMNLVEQQQELADKMVVSSPAGEWSDPIEARAPLHPFITSAYAPGQDRGAVAGRGLGSAVAEVYRFYDGRWWHSQFTLEPGQRVGGVREAAGEPAIDFGTDWFVLDIVEDTDADGSSSQGPGREGRAARVVLQHIHTGEITEIRHPKDDRIDATRERLQDEVQLASG